MLSQSTGTALPLPYVSYEASLDNPVETLVSQHNHVKGHVSPSYRMHEVRTTFNSFSVKQSPPSGAEVKECVALYLHPQYVFMEWCYVKDRDNFTFTLRYVTIQHHWN
jgi:hypothetical protein